MSRGDDTPTLDGVRIERGPHSRRETVPAGTQEGESLLSGVSAQGARGRADAGRRLRGQQPRGRLGMGAGPGVHSPGCCHSPLGCEDTLSVPGSAWGPATALGLFESSRVVLLWLQGVDSSLAAAQHPGAREAVGVT